jgi:hypothetical protein
MIDVFSFFRLFLLALSKSASFYLIIVHYMLLTRDMELFRWKGLKDIFIPLVNITKPTVCG